LKLADIKHILVVDIETVAATATYSTLEPRLQAEWIKKSGHLKNDEKLTAQELYESRAGIYAEFGKVICIGVGFFTKNENGIFNLRVKAFYGDNEAVILSEFKDLVENRFDKEKTCLCAHNGKEFDYPYLCRRFLVNGIPIPAILDLSARKPWEVNHIDTMDYWKFGDRKSYTSLELLAAIFNIDTSKSDMDGSKVNHVYHIEKNLDKIKNYCLQDVIVTANLYLKLNCLSIIGPENVIIT
jgi:predicted PolB exonuclease-like 3'-5' exonuclease